jgi:hypothetical protein
MCTTRPLSSCARDVCPSEPSCPYLEAFERYLEERRYAATFDTPPDRALSISPQAYETFAREESQAFTFILRSGVLHPLTCRTDRF